MPRPAHLLLAFSVITAAALVTPATAQTVDPPDEFIKEYRLGVHGSAGLSLGWYRHRPGASRGFGLTVGVDYEMLTFSFLDGTCTYWAPDRSRFSGKCSRYVWNALHVAATVVARTSRWYGVEAGPSLTLYLNGDEGSEPGLMAGLQGLAEIGFSPLFVGAALRVGIASDPFFGTGFEMVWAPHLRLVFHRMK